MRSILLILAFLLGACSRHPHPVTPDVPLFADRYSDVTQCNAAFSNMDAWLTAHGFIPHFTTSRLNWHTNVPEWESRHYQGSYKASALPDFNLQIDRTSLTVKGSVPAGSDTKTAADLATAMKEDLEGHPTNTPTPKPSIGQ